PHVDQLVRKHVRRLHERGVDGDAAVVVQVRVGDGGAVDLRLQHVAGHELLLVRTRLSMRRVVPIQTASARSARSSMRVSGVSVSGWTISAYSTRASGSRAIVSPA